MTYPQRIWSNSRGYQKCMGYGLAVGSGDGSILSSPGASSFVATGQNVEEHPPKRV